MNLYRSSEWKIFRDDALHLSNWRCERCTSSKAGGAILHVHHRFYVTGRKPWEYSHEDCEVLCQSCHAQEHGFIPPKTGWDFVGYADLGSPDMNCEYCGTEIRHVFMIQHPKWMTLEVGEICCDNLTTTDVATTYMVTRKRLLSRRKRFVSNWKSDAQGLYIQHRGINVRIISADKAFRLRMNGARGKQIFQSTLEAKIKAFEVIDSGAAERYLEKQSVYR